MKNKLKSFLILALAVLCMQTTFLNTVFCIEADGHSQIEISQLGSCETANIEKECSIMPGGDDSCENCTDIPLNTEVLSKYEPGKKGIEHLSFLPQDLLTISQIQDIFALHQKKTTFHTSSESHVFYHHQLLQSIILII